MARPLILTRIWSVAVVGAFAAGCMALPNSDRTMFQEPPLPNRGTLPLKAGLMTLVDARPADGRQSLKEIEDFPDRITLEVLMDLSEAQLFRAIGHESAGVDVILKGEIRSFSWTPRYNWVPYVPALGTLAAFGVPVAYSRATVELTLDIIDAKSNQPIVSYTKAATGKNSYWVYRYQDFTAGSDRDTDSAFRQVVGELQTAILADGDRIVAAVKR
jgi:hypothetical protein